MSKNSDQILCNVLHSLRMFISLLTIISNVGWLVGCFFINVDLAIFQPYLDLEAGDNQSLKIQVARRGIEPRSASQELNHSATAAPILSNNCINSI